MYDKSYLGSKSTITTGKWSCLISFANAPPTCKEGKQAKKGEWTVSRKALKIYTENMNLRYKTMFTSFDQTAKFYDNHIFFTMICIFWPKCFITCNGKRKSFLSIVPPFLHHDNDIVSYELVNYLHQMRNALT